jgi:hypothetical protein
MWIDDRLQIYHCWEILQWFLFDNVSPLIWHPWNWQGATLSDSMYSVHNLRLLPPCKWDLHSSGMLSSILGCYAAYWDVKQHRLVIGYWHFRTIHQSHLLGSRRPSSSWTVWPPKVGPVGCPEMSETKYKCALHNIPEEWRSQYIYWPVLAPIFGLFN